MDFFSHSCAFCIPAARPLFMTSPSPPFRALVPVHYWPRFISHTSSFNPVAHINTYICIQHLSYGKERETYARLPGKCKHGKQVVCFPVGEIIRRSIGAGNRIQWSRAACPRGMKFTLLSRLPGWGKCRAFFLHTDFVVVFCQTPDGREMRRDISVGTLRNKTVRRLYRGRALYRRGQTTKTSVPSCQ